MRSILCFGDSNTWGCIPQTGPEPPQRYAPSQRWPGVLRRELGDGYCIVEEGLNGRTAARLTDSTRWPGERRHDQAAPTMQTGTRMRRSLPPRTVTGCVILEQERHMDPPIVSPRATPTAFRGLLHLSAALLTLLLTAALGGCGGGSDSPGGAGGTTAGTTAPASTAGVPSTSEPVVLADGRHPVYLKSVDPGQRSITFDLIQFFTGDAATKAAAEDHEESPPPNDYYIRNVNPRLRTLPVRDDAPITVNVLAAQATGSATKNVSVTLAKLATYFPNSGTPPFWITVEQGQVTKITQQYLP